MYKWARMIREWDRKDPIAHLVYYALASFADDNGRCWPSWKALLTATGLSRWGLGKALTRLEEYGKLKREHPGSGPWKGVIYRLVADVDQSTKATDQSTSATEAVNVSPLPVNLVDTEVPRRTKEVPKKKNSCSEPLPAAEPEAPPPPDLETPAVYVATLLLSGKIGRRNITELECAEWAKLYSGVDVITECGKMAGWCIGNPKLRKTARGADRFIHAWLGRAQNQSRSNGNGNGKPARENASQYFARKVREDYRATQDSAPVIVAADDDIPF